MKRVRLLLIIHDRNLHPIYPPYFFDVIDPPESHKAHYPNDDQNAWIRITSTGEIRRLVRQVGFMQFEYIENETSSI